MALKKDLENEIILLKERIEELENSPNDIRLNRVNVALDFDKHNRNINCCIYQGIWGSNEKTINFEFSQSIKLIPSAGNSFKIEFIH